MISTPISNKTKKLWHSKVKRHAGSRVGKGAPKPVVVAPAKNQKKPKAA